MGDWFGWFRSSTNRGNNHGLHGCHGCGGTAFCSDMIVSSSIRVHPCHPWFLSSYFLPDVVVLERRVTSRIEQRRVGQFLYGIPTLSQNWSYGNSILFPIQYPQVDKAARFSTKASNATDAQSQRRNRKMTATTQMATPAAVNMNTIGTVVSPIGAHGGV